MDRQTLKAEKRKVLGKAVKRLRQEGILPANVYGDKTKSLSIQVDQGEFEKTYREAGETGVVDLLIGSEKKPALVHNVQVHPVTGFPLHIDFLQVDLKKKVTASVPIEIVGESPAEKQGLGTAVQQTAEVEVEALPTDLPEKFEVDITQLTEVDQAIHIKDLKVEKEKVELKADLEAIIVKVEPLRKEEEEAPPPTEVEGEEEAEGEEGDEKKEGEEGEKETEEKEGKGKEGEAREKDSGGEGEEKKK